jgi:hypothetical protein
MKALLSRDLNNMEKQYVESEILPCCLKRDILLKRSFLFARPVYPNFFYLSYPLNRLFIYKYPPLFITPAHPSIFLFS